MALKHYSFIFRTVYSASGARLGYVATSHYRSCNKGDNLYDVLWFSNCEEE